MICEAQHFKRKSFIDGKQDKRTDSYQYLSISLSEFFSVSQQCLSNF